MQRAFSRLAIVNRGEPAMRLIHAVRELNEQRAEPITVIALFTESERDAMFVRHADEAICLGPEPGRRRSTAAAAAAISTTTRSSARCRRAGADAAWVGWGFVAEQPEFAELCERLGIVFVGPDAAIDAPARRQDRRQAAGRGGGRPGRPVERRPGRDRRGGAATRRADRLPADDQGGGRRRRPRDPPRRRARRARRPRSPARAPRRFRRSATAPCCSRRSITPARHIEVQIIADGQGNVWSVGVRDCSYQRRNQKVIEESASPALTAEQERELMAGRPAARAARRLPQRGHGRVPLRARGAPVLVHGGQRAPAGRASGDRGRHRPRPGQAAAARRRGRPPRGRAARARRPRDRGAAERRGSRARVRARARSAGAAAAADRARASGSTPGSPRAT